MAIQTNTDLNVLTLTDIEDVAPVLMSARNSKGRPVALHGLSSPGAGKTMTGKGVAMQAARAKPGVPFGYATHNVSNFTPADIAGFALFSTYGGKRYSEFTVPAIFRFTHVYIADASGNVRVVTADDSGNPVYVGSMVDGVPVDHGLIVLDEFMQADVENRKACAPLMDEGRISTHFLPPGVAVWAFSNRASDKSGAGKALAFLTNREAQITIKPNPDGLKAYFRGEAFAPDPILPLAPIDPETGRANGRISHHPIICAYLEQNIDLLHAGVPNDPSQPFLTPRSLELVSNIFDSMMVESDDRAITFASDARRARIFTGLAAGIIGTTNATALNTTIGLFGEIPTLFQMVADPKGAVVSTKNDANLIAAYVAGNGMNMQNGEALCTYLKRLPDIYAKNAMVNAMLRDGSLLSVPSIAALTAADPSIVVRMMTAKARARSTSTSSNGYR